MDARDGPFVNYKQGWWWWRGESEIPNKSDGPSIWLVWRRKPPAFIFFFNLYTTRNVYFFIFFCGTKFQKNNFFFLHGGMFWADCRDGSRRLLFLFGPSVWFRYILCVADKGEYVVLRVQQRLVRALPLICGWCYCVMVLIERESDGLIQQMNADFHGEIGDADARPGRPPERNEAAPVPAVSQVVFVQPPAGPAHPRPHGRKTLPLLLLRPTLQAAQPRPAAHSPPHRSVCFPLSPCGPRPVIGSWEYCPNVRNGTSTILVFGSSLLCVPPIELSLVAVRLPYAEIRSFLLDMSFERGNQYAKQLGPHRECRYSHD